MSVIRYTTLRPFVMHVNHTGAALTAALTAKPAPSATAEGDAAEANAADSDAVIGGTTD
jgi:hypothetical protein